MFVSEVGAAGIYLIIRDGGSDWVSTETMISHRFPWIFSHPCLSHKCSLTIKDIYKISEIQELLVFLLDAQKWFSTHRLAPLLARFCSEHYGVTRAFVFPADTRMGGRLIQIKRFLSMKEALQSLVTSAQYLEFDFDNDIFSPRIQDPELWDLMYRIEKAAGPIMLLLRLGDSNKCTLSKVKGTCDYISTMLRDSGENTLEDRIACAFHNRLPEFQSDMTNAAYILDPQFVLQSRKATRDVMDSFWKVTRQVLKCYSQYEWDQMRQTIVTELLDFRMMYHGFAMEDYSKSDACAFWGVAGCHAPNLQRLAFILCALPSSSGSAERNWKEVQNNLTKQRNKLDREKLMKVVFVRRFLRLKRQMANDEDTTGAFKQWREDLLKKASFHERAPSPTDPGPRDVVKCFEDSIEPGEQRKINGQELGPNGEPFLSLSVLKKDPAIKSWLFEKYYSMHFVDKNPDSPDPDAPPLEDQSEWEHRVITNVVWWRSHGWSVQTQFFSGIVNQSIEKYAINSKLHEMIRDSPRNVRPMRSEMRTTTNSSSSDSSSSDDGGNSSSDGGDGTGTSSPDGGSDDDDVDDDNCDGDGDIFNSTDEEDKARDEGK